MTEAPASIGEHPSGPETLIVQARYPHLRPDVLFGYWIQPDLLRRWWPQEAEIEACEGGSYALSWPDMNWHLRGQYDRFEPGATLGFTWSWDHEPDVAPSHVLVEFEPDGPDGSLLIITHGPYTDSPAGREQRSGNLEGWTHFLTKLHEQQRTRP